MQRHREINHRNNRKGGTASLRSRTCVKGNAVFGARFKGLSLYFLYQTGNLMCIKAGLVTYLIRIQTRTPLSRYPPYDYSKIKHPNLSGNFMTHGSLHPSAFPVFCHSSETCGEDIVRANFSVRVGGFWHFYFAFLEYQLHILQIPKVELPSSRPGFQ